MNIIQYTSALLVAFSLVFGGQAEAKHAHEKTRARVLKEISQNASHQTQYSKVKKAHL